VEGRSEGSFSGQGFVFDNSVNEKRISKKFRLLFEILNPTLKDGLMIFNDPMPIIHCLFHKN